MKTDKLYFVYMFECINRIETYVAEGKKVFLKDIKTQDAVLRNLHTLAESSIKVSVALKALHPEIPWKDIASFRNIIVHDYLGLDLEQIWEVVSTDVPVLKSKLHKIPEHSLH